MNGLRNFKYTVFLAVLLCCSSAYAVNWQKIVNKYKNALITLRYYAPYKLNNESIGTFFATGTIVDKKNGIVLVDRETSQVSPSVITGYLQNYEEIKLKTLYYDPIHNFAFLKFDPSTVKWSELAQIELGDSDKLKLGDPIMLLSTKKNKNLGVVHGNIVDIREPKRRNQFKYQDYNISYFDTSLVSIDEGGGVLLDSKGKAIALHAWVHEPDPYDYDKDKNFFAELPINFVKDSLFSLVNSNPVKRGDIGALLSFMTFSEALKFGVDLNLIDKISKVEQSNSLLYISSVVQGTKNEKLINVGDIIISVNGQYIGRNFLKYEKILNSNVDDSVVLEIIRNKKSMTLKVSVLDLLRTKTKSFVLFSGGVFQNIPWFIKARTNIGNQGVYVSSYYRGSPMACSNFFENNVIINVNGRPIRNLDDFYKTVKDLQDKELIKVKYIDLILYNKEYIRSFRVNTNFYTTRRFAINGKDDGDWKEINSVN